MKTPILVGYDGSPGAEAALRWALAEGRMRGLPVHVVQVFEWPVNVAPGELGWLSDRQREEAQSELDQAVATAGGGTETSIVEGSTVGTLCQRSRDSAMIVLGSRGHGTLSSMLLGSVGASVAVHAGCPVVIVRGTHSSAGLPVTVGVDDSAEAKQAAQFAFAEASVRGCALSVVHAWHPMRDPSGELDTAERYALRQAVSAAANAYPQVEWSINLIADGAAKALIDFSSQSQLVVVGHRGAGGFKGLLLGSVAQQLLHHAQCPVAVVR